MEPAAHAGEKRIIVRKVIYIRDYATLEQLVVLSNMESINAVMLHQELVQSERIMIAISQ